MPNSGSLTKLKGDRGGAENRGMDMLSSRVANTTKPRARKLGPWATVPRATAQPRILNVIVWLGRKRGIVFVLL